MKYKKVLAAAIAFVLAASLFTSCTASGSDSGKRKITVRRPDDQDTETQEAAPDDLDAEEAAAEDADATTPDATDTAGSAPSAESAESTQETGVKSQEQKELFKIFLGNKAKLEIDAGNDFGTYISLKDLAGKEFDLEGLTNELLKLAAPESQNVKFDRIRYSYIDCGYDGKAELALEFTFESDESWTETILVREENGKLKTFYSTDGWSRSKVFITDGGYIKQDGSGGAGVHYYSKSFLDADGGYHFIYSDTSSDGVFYNGFDYKGTFYELSSDNPLPKELSFLAFDFDEDQETDSVYTYLLSTEKTRPEDKYGYTSYYYAIPQNEPSIYDKGDPIRDFFDELDVEVVSLKDIEDMIAKSEKEAGLTDEVKDSIPIGWKDLDFDFEPEMPGLNDENFLGVKDYFPVTLMLAGYDGISPTLTIESDGSINASFQIFDFGVNDGSITQNNMTGKFVVTKQISDTVFELELQDFKLEHEAGTSEDLDFTDDLTYTIHYEEIPGLKSGTKRFKLYCPGTKAEDITEDLSKMMQSITPVDINSDGVLDNTYLLCSIDGEGDIWSRWG